MNTEGGNNWQEEMMTPTSKVNVVVELNSDVLETLHSLQVELKSFRENCLNERNEQQSINDALLCNMTGGSP